MSLDLFLAVSIGTILVLVCCATALLIHTSPARPLDGMGPPARGAGEAPSGGDHA